jgi:hypothetical protein
MDNVSRVTRYSQATVAFGDSAETRHANYCLRSRASVLCRTFLYAVVLEWGLRAWRNASRFIYGQFKTILKHKKVNVSKNCSEVTHGSADVLLSGGEDSEILVCSVCFITRDGLFYI